MSLERAKGSWPPVLDAGEHVLRPMRREDAAAWFAYLSDAAAVEHTSWPRLSAEAIAALVVRLIGEYATGGSCRWALSRGAEGDLIGTCGFNAWVAAHRRAELAYDLAPAWWGHGIMTKAVAAVVDWAFAAAEIDRIEAFVMTSNSRSIALLERAGFEREGLLRSYRVARGRPRDFFVYSRLRGDVTAASAASPAVTLRAATGDDAPAIAEVIHRSRTAFVPYAPMAHSPAALAGWLAAGAVAAGAVQVATVGSVIVGVLAWSHDGKASWIDQLYVLPGHTGQGIGQRLLDFAHATRAPPIRLHTFQENRGARRFYERYGYRVLALTDGSGNEERCPDVLYEWRPPSAPAAG